MTVYRRQQTLSLCLEQKKDLKPDKVLFWHNHNTFGKDIAVTFPKITLYLHPESWRGVLRGQAITSHHIFSSLSKNCFHIFLSFMFPSTFLYEQKHCTINSLSVEKTHCGRSLSKAAAGFTFLSHHCSEEWFCLWILRMTHIMTKYKCTS